MRQFSGQLNTNVVGRVGPDGRVGGLSIIEGVYSSSMDKAPTVAVLSERVGTAITFAKWLGGGFATIACAVAVFMLLKLTDHGEKLASLQTHIEGIEAEQKKTIPALIAEALKSPSPDNLKVVARVLESSRKLDKKSDQEFLASDGQALYRLAASPAPPSNVWSAGAQLVSYRSEQSKVPVGANPADCFSRPPAGAEVQLLADHTTFRITGRKIYSGCVLHLDAKGGQTFAFPDGVVFQNCIVEYSGALPLVSATIQFTNCVFLLTASDEITVPGRLLLLALLKAPNLSSVDITLPSS